MDLDEVAALSEPVERLQAYAELAGSTDDPVVAVRAKLGEISAARRLERQTHAVVAGTELISLVEVLPPAGEPIRLLSRGFGEAAAAALDLPEIPLETVDGLLAVMERVLVGVGKRPYAVWELEARRHYIAGDLDAVRERVERLIPHVSRENHWRHEWECPGCCLCAFVGWIELGPQLPSPEAVYAVLEPILGDGPVRWNEDPALVPALDRWYGGKPCCTGSLEEAHVQYARASCAAGNVGAAVSWLARSRRHREKLRLVTMLGEAEIALALGEETEIRRTTEQALDGLRGREDVNEAWLLGIVAHRSLAHLGDPRADAVRVEAYAHARRLDARIPRPRHVSALDRLL